MNTPPIYFDHEKLVAYQRSIQFVVWAKHRLENVSSKLAVQDQFDRASTSVPLNIAEGHAKYTAPDRCHTEHPATFESKSKSRSKSKSGNLSPSVGFAHSTPSLEIRRNERKNV